MNKHRVPPKARHRERPQRARSVAEPVQTEDPNSYSAPSHMGGQFDDAGYGSGHGPIGFTQHVLP